MGETLSMALAGAAAGAVTGVLGAGGGMVLVPLLTLLTALEPREVFAASLGVILPICLICLAVSWPTIPWREALWYLPGSALGGLAAGLWGQRLPVTLLHRALGALILWGGVRSLWL